MERKLYTLYNEDEDAINILSLTEEQVNLMDWLFKIEAFYGLKFEPCDIIEI